jgi:hypothetical protein
MNKKMRRVSTISAKFKVGQHVRVSKEKSKVTKVSEQNFGREIFCISKVTKRIPRPIYELEDLNKTPI